MSDSQVFTKYRFINELSGRIIYELLIGETIDHEAKINKKKINLNQVLSHRSQS